jgi:hypothetical protein
MNMPGFTGERSLNKTSDYRSSIRATGSSVAQVLQQARPLHFFDCLEIFGGRCFFGDQRKMILPRFTV